MDILRLSESVWYSTYFLPKGMNLASCNLRFFVLSLGQAGQGYKRGLTLSETNLMTLPHTRPGALDVQSIVWLVRSPSEADRQACFWNGLISWDFSQTWVDVAPLLHGPLFDAQRIANFDQWARLYDSLGPNLSFGSFFYTHTPVRLLQYRPWSILIRFGGTSYTLQEDMEIRVQIQSEQKHVIEVG